jgi:hypothetical protein
MTTEDVLANARTNGSRSWNSGAPGTSAKERLTASGAIKLNHTPKFKLDPTWPIFTVGSCFARVIENTLIELELPVALRGFGIPMRKYKEIKNPINQPPNTLLRTCFNKFSVHSMTHDIKRVLEGIAYPDEGLIELARDKWFDPHSYHLKLASYDEAMDNRRAIHCGMLEIKNSKAVIMTLGLTETWLDTRTGLAMNEHPGGSWLARMPDRWQFIDYGYADILDEMVRMLQLIRQCTRADMKFIVTVSPIPLGATCKTQDVIVATSGSKCVLRAVAEELYRRFDFVDYFPSYECVMYSPRNITWLEDQLHVNPDITREITRSFLLSYYSRESEIAGVPWRDRPIKGVAQLGR